jgi:hypothetical protein
LERTAISRARRRRSSKRSWRCSAPLQQCERSSLQERS